MYGEGISKHGELLDLAVTMDIVKKSGSWFYLGEERIGQGRDNAKQYFIDHPDICDEIEAKVRENLLAQGSRRKAAAAAQPAAKAVDISADDFNDEAN